MHATTTHASARTSGFTLVELLVVIAVIAILIGVLLPALAGAREAGYRSVSAGNLKSIATLMNVYANDYDTEFPMIPGNPRGKGIDDQKSLPASYLSMCQANWGGFAGFFSINQVAKSGAYNGPPVYSTWDRGAGKWVRRGSTGITPGSPEADELNDKAPLPMKAYIEGNADYQMLQNPADRLDGGENGTKTPAVTPTTIKDEKDVVWYNISYLYIAGLNQRTPQLGLLGDETNHSDGGNGGDLGFIGTPKWGTLRKNRDDGTKPGYSSVDNHGDAGGNFAYTDAHVEWIQQRHGVPQSNPYAVGMDPHDRIFAEIQQFLSGGTVTIETID